MNLFELETSWAAHLVAVGWRALAQAGVVLVE